MIVLSCPNCHIELRAGDGIHFACPNAFDNRHHYLEPSASPVLTDPSQLNPYMRFRKNFFSYHADRDQLWSSDLKNLDAYFMQRFGKPMRITPLVDATELAAELNHDAPLWIKDETGQPGGSHKIRHLLGTALYLKSNPKPAQKQHLAIYSCGNAARSAAILAEATGMPLCVYLPESVRPSIVEQLHEYGAQTQICARTPGIEGDPSYLAFHHALKKGAIPFSCSGPDNWSNLEGGKTLIWECQEQWGEKPPEAIYIQVGGGALAASALLALEDSKMKSRKNSQPRVCVVQTQSCFPLARIYLGLLKKLTDKIGLKMSLSGLNPSQILNYLDFYFEEYSKLASIVSGQFEKDQVQSVLCESLNQPIWQEPWTSGGKAPASLAYGILDDVTYDWYPIIRGLFASGGWPVVVNEDELSVANKKARTLTDIPVDATGTSGLAGLLHDVSQGRHQGSALVFFTGKDEA